MACIVGIAVAAWAAGCEAPVRKYASSDVAPQQRIARVFVLRGWMDLHSQGLEDLARELAARGAVVSVHGEAAWSDVATRAADVVDLPLVLIGFSFGADSAILAARQLVEQQRRVDLLVTIDPVWPGKVPVNVARCVNFYLPPLLDVVPAFRGVAVSVEDPTATRLSNVDLNQQAELLEGNDSHGTLPSNAKLRRRVVDEVLAVREGA